MKIFFRLSLIILSSLVLSLVQTDFVGAHPNPNPNSGSRESAEIHWERNKETTNPTTEEISTTPEPKPEPPIKASTCPDGSRISACYCSNYYHQIKIGCGGPEVEQRSIEKLFKELRRVNRIPQDRRVLFHKFELRSTKLTQLDLAPFYGSQMEYLNMVHNSNLTRLVTSGNGNPEDQDEFIGSIHVQEFRFFTSPIKREGFGDALKYFANEMTLFDAFCLDLSNNNTNNNNTLEDELIPGLSALSNLVQLDLSYCEIGGSLTSSHFKPFSRLELISLLGNKISGVGENVFPSSVSSIDLSGNQLNETSIHPNSGIARNRAGRTTILWLEKNQFTTLPPEIFQTFLDAHPENQLVLWGNPLACDEKLGWLKSRWAEFKTRLALPYFCSNDPGHAIFNSYLIP